MGTKAKRGVAWLLSLTLCISCLPTAWEAEEPAAAVEEMESDLKQQKSGCLKLPVLAF